MTNPPPYPDADGETGTGRRPGSANGRPRWVPVAGIVVAIGLVLLIIALHVTGTLGPPSH